MQELPLANKILKIQCYASVRIEDYLYFLVDLQLTNFSRKREILINVRHSSWFALPFRFVQRARYQRAICRARQVPKALTSRIVTD